MDDQATEQSATERMMALLDAEEAQQDAPEVEEQASQEATQDTEVQEESEVEAEAQPEPRKLKLKWNDEEKELPEDEVIKLAQQGYDYTQKTQKVADERRAVEERDQAIKAQESSLRQQAELQQALIKDIAKVTAVDEELAKYERVNWQELNASDPSQAQGLFFQYTQLSTQRNKLIQELNQKQGSLVQQQQARQRELVSKGIETLQREIPNWGSEEVTKSIRESAKSMGFTEKETSEITDHRVIKALYEAAQYKKLQSAKPALEKRVAGKPPVVKPGSKDVSAADKSKKAELQKRLRTSGKIEDAAALIEQTL